MALSRMALGRYRGFAKRQVIDLAPITVVLGRNNAGKSALVRAPVVLATGLDRPGHEPLDLDRLGEDLVDSFSDLVHGSRLHLKAIDVELEVDTKRGPIRITASVRHLADHFMQIVDRFEMSVAGVRLCHLEWELGDPRVEPHLYTATIGDGVWPGVRIPFRGLLPELHKPLTGVPAETLGPLREAIPMFFGAFPTVRYLGPFRDRPRRRYRLPNRRIVEVGVAGEYTAAVLADDQRRSGSLLDQVNVLLREHLPGWRVAVVDDGAMRSVVLTGADGVQVNLADTGTGVAQALPIFVQRALDDMIPANRPVLEIVEQPELHLHPAAHADLAELFLAAVGKRKATQFLIETHSETFLLRLRRHVAKGLDPATIAIYFVEQTDGVSHARRINLEPDGNVDYWPEGVFAEDFVETRELARAQRERRADDAR